MNQRVHRIVTGSRVGIVGGGPAGCFFALYLLHYARLQDLRPDVTIFEARGSLNHGSGGCKGCAGILSTSLLQNLAEVGLAVPDELVQHRIAGYTVQSAHTSITMRSPDDAQVISVFRGCGPRGNGSQILSGFDAWLLSETSRRGVTVEHRVVTKLRAGKPFIVESADGLREFDLVVLATGVNAKLPTLEGFQYIAPKTQTMSQDELYIDPSGNGDSAARDVAHAFLIPNSGLIAGCLVPKGPFINVSVLNKSGQLISVSEFLQNEKVQAVLPEGYKRVCGCSPKVPVTSAQNYYGDGFIAVGDAAASRLYKDGIGSALRTSREAAQTVVRHGFFAAAFKRHYVPLCRKIERDNRWGKRLFWMNDKVKESRTFLWAQHRLIREEQTAASGLKPFTRAVWGIFTGSYTYRNIAGMALRPSSLSRLIFALLRESSTGMFNKDSGTRKLLIRNRKVLILGSGFSGIYVLRNLVPALNKNENVETILVSDENFFLFAPLLHEVAMGRIETRHIAYPIRRLHWRDRFSFVHGKVENIDLKSRRVKTSAGILEYDYLVLALGSVADTAGLNRGNENAFTLKSLHDSMLIRNHIIQLFEQALVEKDYERKRQLLTFVVSGGGYKGVQVVTELRDFIANTLLKLYRPIDPDMIRIILVEAEDKTVNDLQDPFGAYIMKQLRKMSIEVKPGCRITRSTAEYVEINGALRVPASTLIWVAGVVANPGIAAVEAEKDGAGRVMVDECLKVPGFPGVYAAGDCAHLKDPSSGLAIPPRAYTAVRQARTVARNILAEIRDGAAKPYHHRRTPHMVSLGSSRAVVKYGNVRLYGVPARLVWMAAYVLLITGNYNRVRIMMDWLLSFLFGRDTTLLDLEKNAVDSR